MEHVTRSVDKSMKSMKSMTTMYEGGDATWFDGVTAAQTTIMEKASLKKTYSDYILKKMSEMKTKKCTVCGCLGHINSYCWLNA
jgi:hypothetical protein